MELKRKINKDQIFKTHNPGDALLGNVLRGIRGDTGAIVVSIIVFRENNGDDILLLFCRDIGTGNKPLRDCFYDWGKKKNKEWNKYLMFNTQKQKKIKLTSVNQEHLELLIME